MQLIRRQQNRNAAIPRNVFGEVRDLGARLEHLVSRYERLVRDVETAGSTSATDMEARVRMANRDLSFVAVQLQQLLVEEVRGAARRVPRGSVAEALTFDEAEIPFGMLPNVASA